MVRTGVHREADIIEKARRANEGKPFKIFHYAGEVTVLPSEYADLVAFDKRLSLGAYLKKDFHTHLSGLNPIAALHDEQMLLHKIVRRFSKNLARDDFRRLLVSQAVQNTNRLLGHTQGWSEICIYDFVLDSVARLDVRALWGETLSNNEEWIALAKTYMPSAVAAAIQLSIAPKPMYYLVRLLAPDFRRVLRLARQAEDIIVPIVEERRKSKAQAIADGLLPSLFDDAFEWAEKESMGSEYDIAGTQLALLISAVHTSADLITQALILLAQRQDAVCQLREEIERVLVAEGLARGAFQKMNLLDSTIKETLRIKPAGNFSVQRNSSSDVQITPELKILKGQSMVVDTSRRLDATVFQDPDIFQPDRFLRLRQDPRWGAKALLVSTSSEHLAFGHGNQVCPGRFFVDLKVKILLCHLLLSFDWKLAPGTNTEPSAMGPLLIANQKTRILSKRREDAFEMMKL
ncbi:hypothetical protein M409DRAFT_66208 [Zasmidium cellare ATCC 36951]|uniref:Cytochrome P450 n=1 Tax=Zasmidium cellare ATCC 36951 TaxID=1080233 RepID=A0A6A6CNW2_ZASCE|nr:uncharacterized protein M409DRAFT_66208 [Zasmidium cellare ATCC 36951]KAF2167166.1 hypothetical protein M409DRAFT_66208 [Zasmidium cellare ATCC 36951]